LQKLIVAETYSQVSIREVLTCLQMRRLRREAWIQRTRKVSNDRRGTAQSNTYRVSAPRVDNDHVRCREGQQAQGNRSCTATHAQLQVPAPLWQLRISEIEEQRLEFEIFFI
jgi:hypothetical protein